MPVSFIGAGNFKGTWDANANSGSADFLNTGEPLLASSASATAGYNVAVTPAQTASVGDYWQVTTAGSTNIDGETNWQLNDWCLYVSSSDNGLHWRRLSVSDTVASVTIGEASSEGLKTDLLASASAQSGPNNAYGKNGEILFCSSSDAAGNNKYFEGSNALTWNSNGSVLNLTGTLKVSGTIEATTLHTVEVTSSVLFEDGSTRFGNSTDDSHEFSGSVYVLTGLTSSAGISGSYLMGDGSRLTGITAGSTLGNPGYGNAATSRVPFFGVIDGASKLGLSGSANFSFFTASNDLQVTGNIRASNLYVGDFIYHEGDTDTYVRFQNGGITTAADATVGSVLTSTGLTINPGNATGFDFLVETANFTRGLHVDGGSDNVGIRTAPSGVIEALVVSGSTLFGSASASTHRFTGSLVVSNGIYTTQDIIHWDDTNTKITFTDDQIDFTAGGVTLLSLDETTQDIVIVGDGTDVDFQVKGLNDNHAIFLEGSSDKVGIGFSSPAEKLSVSGSTVFGRPNGEADKHTFSGSVYVSDDIHVADRISHLDDSNTFFNFNADTINATVGGIRAFENSTNTFEFNPDGETFTVSAQGSSISNTFYINGPADNVGIRCAPLNLPEALAVSGSTLFGSASANSHQFTGSVYVSNNIAFAGNLQNAADDDTYIDFLTDRMRFFAGNIQFADFLESATGQDAITFNGNSSDVDLIIKSDPGGGTATTAHSHTVFVEASSARVGIAESSPGAQLDVSGSTIIGRNDGATISSNQIRGTLYVTGNVGINTAVTGYSLTLPNSDDFLGRGMAYAWSTYSSARYKQNVTPLSNPIETAKKLQGVEFTWKESGHKDFGFIAEEVGKVLPQLVSYEPGGKNAIGMDYSKITSLLVECVKQQQEQIETQEDRIKQLEKKLKS
tara:strand:+ start:133 stop:2838 length:2706 start_codon:yes stop_codon:yes gene_type:complete